jgi:hypothetical protein
MGFGRTGGVTKVRDGRDIAEWPGLASTPSRTTPGARAVNAVRASGRLTQRGGDQRLREMMTG